jgi:hypothetical protein
MPKIALLLGPVTFQDFEVPEAIIFGGRQRLAVHELPGGARVIDALGRDDAPIIWYGVLSGPNATERAHALDLLRAQGAMLPLTWDTFFYTVVISEFRATYVQENWIPYFLSCTVLRDEAEVLIQTGISLIEQAMADVGTAASLLAGSNIVLDNATSALSDPEASVLGTNAYTTALGAMSSAQSSIAGGMSSAEDALSPYLGGDAFASGNAELGVTALSNATNAAGMLAQLSAAQGYINRTISNFLNANP